MMFLNNIQRLVLITTILKSSIMSEAQGSCSSGCSLALGSYYLLQGDELGSIALRFQTTTSDILSYNKDIPNQDTIIAGTRIIIPLSSCDCLDDRRGARVLGHNFRYTVVSGDTYQRVAETRYRNLTSPQWLQNFNSYPVTNIPDANAVLNVTVNCSCGDANIDKRYGLFITWPLREGENLQSVATANNLTGDLIQRYNPNVNFSSGVGLLYIPGKDINGNYPPLDTSSGGLKSGAVAGISVAAVVVFLLCAGWLFFAYYRKKTRKLLLLSQASEDQSNRAAEGNMAVKPLSSSYPSDGGLTGISVDKSVEFTYEELAKATDDFSIANKIGQGGFGAVYYAELRGEKAAIKKMDMQASREFLAELKVLTHVHHLNLVRLIGYCVEGSLFLVYEFIENGNLSQHLRGSAKDPLSWSTRVQIALDSARGLEYIHEHTVPVYIHRDIKSANILIDGNFHGKVADFGLTKLTEVSGNSLPTRLVGTFGYMPPEYARYGDVSPKVDVYAFGVVLYELISAKEAIVKPNGTGTTESKGLVGLFEDVLSKPDCKEDLRQLVDPRLEDNYPADSVYKLAQLAKACTHENPQLRPSMRSIVVALMTLSSSTEEWDIGSFYGNQGMANLMAGR